MKSDSNQFNEISEIIEKTLSWKPNTFQALSNGDTANAYVFSNSDQHVFVKQLSNERSYEMLEAECLGLNTILESNEIDIPKIIGLFSLSSENSILLLQFIKTVNPQVFHHELLGHQLALMHKNCPSEQFGFTSNNFIGRLDQLNDFYNSFLDFYVNCRLDPQTKMAFDSNLFSKKEINAMAKLYNKLDDLIPIEKASLIHGDLWNGNVLWSETKVFLIDPAVAYSHRESDLAMMHLFGGFPECCFEAYAECYPLEKGWRERMDLFQLYYLLVHVNLFGASYVQSVKKILEKYD